jgi:hypothetical protein
VRPCALAARKLCALTRCTYRTGYVSALIASLPVDTWASIALGKLNTFIQHRRFERRWGNLIRAADEPNPLVGEEAVGWERKRRLKLFDAGLANNLPSRERYKKRPPGPR